MYLTKQVYELSEKFMKDSTFVKMIPSQIEIVAEEMKKVVKPKFPMPDISDVNKAVFLELAAAAVNYCYWYGKATVRPNDVNSTFMYQCLMNAFYRDDIDYSEAIDSFIELIIWNRFPLIEERIKHLNELKTTEAEDFISNLVHRNYNVDPNEPNIMNDINIYMTMLITLFPGFGSDLFLKRASLFFIQLYRRFGWFSDQMHDLHVPADYQIPKMLEHNKCISYNAYLKNLISTNQLIPKHSQMECEIRSATVLTMKKLCELTGWNIAQVDGYFFLQRHEAKENFHMTITTDY